MTDAKLQMKLSCPMPKLDFDIITLGHGSGGLLTNKLLDSGVFDLLSNDWLDHRHDGAILDLSGKTAFTTDSFVVSPIFSPEATSASWLYMERSMTLPCAEPSPLIFH
jgi:hydrogenase expression/formation protein HypE